MRRTAGTAPIVKRGLWGVVVQEHALSGVSGGMRGGVIGLLRGSLHRGGVGGWVRGLVSWG